MEDKVLIVLYYNSKTNTQDWCVYFGGEPEADREAALHLREGTIERGRIWVKEITMYAGV